jgi:hypothetical protein
LVIPQQCVIIQTAERLAKKSEKGGSEMVVLETKVHEDGIVEEKRVKENYEGFYEGFKTKLDNIETEMNDKIETNEEIIEAKETINRVTNEILEEFAEDKTLLEHLLEELTETVLIEPEESDEDEESDTEESEEM